MNRIFGRLLRRSSPETPIDYETAKEIARADDVGARAQLAGRPDTRPELLYFLAEDQAPLVRREIAANGTTPVQADLLLARDADESVRVKIAAKISALAPGLDEGTRARVGDIVTEILTLLARDALPEVRRVLAETLKDVATVPQSVMETLARDSEIAIAAPVLEHSPLLADEVLIEVIASRPVAGILVPISRRTNLGERVSDAVVAADDEEAITALLANPTAQVREETLDRLVDRAERVEAWHAPLVERPKLSPRAIGKLASFVATHLLSRLEKRADIDAPTARAVAAELRFRLAEGGSESERSGAESPLARAQALKAKGALDEAALASALAKADRGYAIALLAVGAELPVPVIEKIVSLKSAKGMVAATWKAGFPAPLATQLQLKLSRIAPDEVLRPRTGDRYPLTPEEMDWQISYFAG